MELRNRWVHFRVCDVHIPEPAQVMYRLYGENLLQGRVKELTENDRETYAVVVVDGIDTPLVVALSRILGVL